MRINKKKDLSLHNQKYENLISQNPEKIFKPRVEILANFQSKIQKIYGNVLDIGAGSGYASIWLAKNSNAEKIICLENSEVAVQRLIPKNIEYYGVQNKVTPLLGSFEELPFDNFFDFIISMGSIHHCNDLYKSMKSINKALKNRGYLIMNEPSMSNYTTNEDYINKYNEEEIFHGEKIKNFERNDRFFREAEYITSAIYVGFDLKYQGLEKKIYFKSFSDKINHIKGLLFKKDYTKLLKLSIFFPFKYIISKLNFSNKKTNKISLNNKNTKREINSSIFFFQKNITNYIPHVWGKLN